MTEPSLRVLIVEDEKEIAALLEDYAVANHYRTRVVHHGDEALPAASAFDPDIVLLDLNLPGTDGLTICRALREQSDVPIMMITARVEEIDRLLGLELGADDYVCKPFSPREVMARIKTIIRRGAPRPTQGGISLNEDQYSANYQGRVIELTRTEFNMLRAMVSQPRRIFSRDQLLDQAYSDGRIVSDRAIDSHIRNLRRKLTPDDGGTSPIQSVYGVGYKYEPAH
ncbi:MAG: DNA-binding response regulator [Lysobacteraceae bacterium]|nr:MAG: DNA-binding response regulator [Xanthomonadaceae bacterium]